MKFILRIVELEIDMKEIGIQLEIVEIRIKAQRNWRIYEFMLSPRKLQHTELHESCAGTKRVDCGNKFFIYLGGFYRQNNPIR